MAGYWGRLKAVWHRVKVGNRTPAIAGNVQISKQLENAATATASFDIVDDTLRPYKRGQRVQIDLIRDNNAGNGDGGRGSKRPVFAGIVDVVNADAFPNKIGISCTGPLGDLALTTDHDVDLTGKTDQEAVRLILKTLGIPHKPGKIKGAGYVIGERNDVIWAAGSDGSSMVEELDRVFGYATIEGPDGDIVRIPYSRVPSDYAGNPKHEFVAGRENQEYFDASRERGKRDQVVNHWYVRGLEYEIGNTEVDGDGDGIAQEGKEGCSRRIWAECKAGNALLGNGVYVTNEFSSDLIQDAGLAKGICERMMRWYNREVDTMRVTVGNDAHVEVGDTVRIKDPAPGIDLGQSADYVVFAVQQDGNLMQLDLIGGAAGKTGLRQGGIRECCGSWEDDDTCTPNEQDDTEAPPDFPDLPDLPDTPDDSWCDPAVDETCLPTSSRPGRDDDAIPPPGTNPGHAGGPVTPGGDPATDDDPIICQPVKPVCPTGDDGLLDGVLCAPSGSVPQGQITGGMPWADINQWDALLADAVDAHPNANVQMLKSMLIIESGGDPYAADGNGAIGLMQIKPAIWQTEATTFGYDLTTPAGQIGMAAAIIGGDAADTAGMDNETAFLSVYYPVLNDAGELCRECFGESGHTPQMYLDDIALFSAAIQAACPPPDVDSTDPPVTLALGGCQSDANCPTGWRCVDGRCDPIPGVSPPPKLRGFARRGVGGCVTPGWNRIGDGLCAFNPAFLADDDIVVYATTDGTIDRIGIHSSASGPASVKLLAGPGLTEFFRLKNTGDLCISGRVRFAASAANLTVSLDGEDPIEPFVAQANFYAAPGLDVDVPGLGTQQVGYQVSNHDNQPIWSGACDPNTFLDDGTCINNGGWGGTPLATGQDGTFSVCFTVDDLEQTVDVDGSFGSGFAEYDPYAAFNGASPDPCVAAWHSIKFDLDPGDAGGPAGVAMQIWDLQILGVDPSMGDDDPLYGNCGENPNYTGEPTEPPAEPAACTDECTEVAYSDGMELPTQNSFVITGQVTLENGSLAEFDVDAGGDLYTLQIGAGLAGTTALLVAPDDTSIPIGTTPPAVGETLSFAIGWDATARELRAEVAGVA